MNFHVIDNESLWGFTVGKAVWSIQMTLCKNILNVCRKRTRKDGEGGSDKDSMYLGHVFGSSFFFSYIDKNGLKFKRCSLVIKYLHSHKIAIVISTGRVKLSQKTSCQRNRHVHHLKSKQVCSLWSRWSCELRTPMMGLLYWQDRLSLHSDGLSCSCHWLIFAPKSIPKLNMFLDICTRQ